MKHWLKGLFVFGFVFLLAACGQGDSEEQESSGNTESGGDAGEQENSTLVVGATNVPHAEILEFASDKLAEEGVDLEIETFNDYIVPNQALEEEEIDANYFQHIPYFETQKAEQGYDFVNAGGVHIEPIGVYSQDYDSLDELPEGAEIIMSSSVADHGRILMMLEEEGLLTLEEGAEISATVDDIAENPKNLQFRDDVEAATLPQAYRNGEGDAVFINSNYALDAELSPREDAIAIEDEEENPYVNIIAVRNGDEDKEEIQTLLEVLRSDEVTSFIEEEYDGAVVPATGEGAEVSEEEINAGTDEEDNEDNEDE
ncbi:D-methionine transport system substrate-binding protein [Alteribacillus persepolensis]|uniref:D-methionine transport system substrate-binding protein n=1 Tax=Alteribacillus persepolensis TaxID=568899 RepID=A0A1G8DVE9_9BACI|nr:MetQ/NlpA family ABC transporter substrate-binding protein [Alteribacillus persepolensis]SDH61585.1 D-methionine transport system substrate-binding protein [Alteribacillus persepolensis]